MWCVVFDDTNIDDFFSFDKESNAEHWQSLESLWSKLILNMLKVSVEG